MIGAVESLGEVGLLCEGCTAEVNETASDHALLATEDSNPETHVLRALEHLVSMKTIERLGRVLVLDCTVDEVGPPATQLPGCRSEKRDISWTLASTMTRYGEGRGESRGYVVTAVAHRTSHAPFSFVLLVAVS